MNSERRAVRCFVSGRVQGVGFRAATAHRARELKLAGVARNLPDGRVEVTACGEAGAIAALAGWLWQGPPLARVRAVEIEDLAQAHQSAIGPEFTTA